MECSYNNCAKDENIVGERMGQAVVIQAAVNSGREHPQQACIGWAGPPSFLPCRHQTKGGTAHFLAGPPVTMKIIKTTLIYTILH